MNTLEETYVGPSESSETDLISVYPRVKLISLKPCDQVRHEDLQEAKQQAIAPLSAYPAAAESDISEVDETDTSLRLEALTATESPRPLFPPVLVSHMKDIYKDAEAKPVSGGTLVLSGTRKHSTCSSETLSFSDHSNTAGSDIMFNRYKRVPSHFPATKTPTSTAEGRSHNATNRVRFRNSNQTFFGNHLTEESPINSSPAFGVSSDTKYAYSDMLRNYLSNSNNVLHMKDAKKATFTCPSCHAFHWRPGRCPCCTQQPQRPVLLTLPWKSHIKLTGLGSDDVLQGKECYLHKRVETPKSRKKTTPEECHSLKFSFVPLDETPSIVSSEDITPPHIEKDNEAWLYKITELLRQSPSTRVYPKLPSLVENPPVLSTSCHGRKSETTKSHKSTTMDISPYMDARSTGLMKSKKLKYFCFH